MQDMGGSTSPRLRVAVFGGSGFLGRPTVNHLRNAGHEVWVLRRSQPQGPHELTLPDLSDGQVQRALDSVSPDVVINMIWITSHGVFWDAPSNHDFLDFSRRLCGIAAEVGSQRLIGVGSSAEYRRNCACVTAGPASESPTSLYGQVKLEAGRHLLGSCSDRGIEGAWARIFQLYGPGEGPTKFISAAVARARDGLPLEVQQPASVRDWIHVDDAAAALADLAVGSVTGVFNVGTSTGTTSLQLARMVSESMGGPPPTVAASASQDQGLDYLVACNDSHLLVRHDKPLRSIREGIVDIISASDACI
jgi:nucleoside-diphosphate-sugar epimerase